MKQKIIYLFIAVLLLSNVTYANNLNQNNVQTPTITNNYIPDYSIDIVDDSKIVITYQNTLQKETIISKNDISLYVGTDYERVLEDKVFTNIKDIETSPDKSKLYFQAKYGDYSPSDPIEYSKKPSYYRYDFHTKTVERLDYEFPNPATGRSETVYPYKLNVTENGNIAVQRRSFNIDYNYVLYNENGEFISVIDSLENSKSIKAVKYASIEYGKNLSDVNKASHFMLYGQNQTKKVRLEDTITLAANTTAHGINTGMSPVLLVSWPNGDLISNTTDSHYVFKMKMSDVENEYGKAGVVFGVENAPLSQNGFTAFAVSINPNSKQVEVERFYNDERGIVKHADLPKGINAFEEISVGITLVPSYDKNVVLMKVYINGTLVIDRMSIGKKVLPAWSNFGIHTHYADVEIKDFSTFGTLTVPRK